MAENRVVELEIKLKGVQTIEELENLTSEINNELKQIDVNSEAFTKMSSLAKQANSQVKEVNESLEGITSTEKAEAVSKLGQGLVGAFQAAAGASLFFGDKTSEELEKVIAKVGGLFAAMDGVKKITEAFSAKNISALKGVVDGFKKSTIAAKLFGTGTRAALTASGIGIIVVILGTIVANWDSVKKAAINAFNTIKEYIPPLKVIGDIIDWISEKFGSLEVLVDSVGAAIKAIFTGEDLKGITEAFEAAAKAGRELIVIRGLLDDQIEKTKDDYESEIAYLEAIGGKEEKIIALKRERILKELSLLRMVEERGDLEDEEKEKIVELRRQLVLLNIAEKKYNETKEKASKEQRKSASEANKAREEELRKRQQELEKLREAILENAKEASIKADVLEITRKMSELQIEMFNGEYNNNVQIEESLLKQQDLQNEILVINGYIQEIDERRKAILENEFYTDKQRATFLKTNEDERLKYTNEIAKLAKNYNLVLSNEEKAKIRLLQYDRELLVLSQKNTTQAIKDNQEKIDSLGKELILLVKSKATEQERLAVINQIQNLEDNNVNLNTSLLSIKTQIASKDKEIKNNLGEALQSQIKSNKESSSFAKKRDEYLEKYAEEILATTDFMQAALEFSAGLYDRKAELAQRDLEDFIEKEQAKTELAISLAEEQADAQKKIQEDLNSDIDALNAELADAEGERYEQILDEIESKKLAQEQAAIEEQRQLDEAAAIKKKYDNELAKRQYEIDMAQYNADKQRKTAALIQAAIEGGLAVIKALPNLVLAGIVGAAVGLSIGKMASQPLPPKPSAPPQFAEGGFTGFGNKYDVAGTVHKGEYVVPKSLVDDPSLNPVMSFLEGMRTNKKGFAEGGFTSPSNPVVPSSSSFIDYQKLADEISNSLRNNPIYVSVTEIRDVSNKLKVIEDRSTIRK